MERAGDGTDAGRARGGGNLPAFLYAVSPQRAGSALRRMSDWLLDHSRMLEIVVGIGFGAILLAKGIASL